MFSFSELYFKQSSTQIGGTYWKAKYIEYMDGTFRVEKERAEEEKHLGILGKRAKLNAWRYSAVALNHHSAWAGARGGVILEWGKKC